MHVEHIAEPAHSGVVFLLRGRSTLVARVLWGGLTLEAGVLFVLSVPARFRQLDAPPADVRRQLAHAGISTGVYAAYLTALGCVLALACCTVAALIVRHRGYDRVGMPASLYLVFFGLANSPLMHAVVITYPVLSLPANLSLLFCVMSLVGFFFLFPDGRIVPRWSRWPLTLYAGVAIGLFFLNGASIAQRPPDWLGMMLMGGAAAGIASQVYRYVRVSDGLQRQQTQWVVLGASGALVTAIVFAAAGPLLPSIGGGNPNPSYDLTSTTGIDLVSLFVPLAVALAMFRHRLWDIDVMLNRAVVYGALTVTLAVLYGAVVIGPGMVLEASGHLPFSILGTALVAVLFAPLRTRLQSAVDRLMYGERNDPYRVLAHVGQRIGSAAAPQAALDAIVQVAANALKSPYAAITLDDAGTRVPAASFGSPLGMLVTLPLEYQGELVGELVVAPRSPHEQYSTADRRLLDDLARQTGAVAHAVRLASDLQRARERLVTAREEERRRLRRDLHDGLGPQLGALALKIETIRNRFSGNDDLDAALVDLTQRTRDALSDLRGLVYALRPPALDQLGFPAAVRQAAEQCDGRSAGGLAVEVDLPATLPPLPAAVEVAAYRVVQEALTNVVRHAAARTCRVSVGLDGTSQTLRIRVVDDGCGLPADYRSGVGIVSMVERAEELGGRCTVEARPAGGTEVVAQLPCAVASGPASPPGTRGI